MSLNKRHFSSFILMLIFSTTLAACSQKPSGMQFEKNVKENVYLSGENIGGMKETHVIQKIKDYGTKINVEPGNARLDSKSWEVAEFEKIGKRVNTEKTIEKLLSSAEGEKVKPIIEEIQPKITSEELQSKVVEIASYSTPILDRQKSRINNIEIASNKLNYKKLAPGEEFSFNSTVGKRTEAKGYEEAPIIVKTEDGYEKGYGLGGGICQIASTLYNAVEKSGMEITERHVHTKNVGYVPKGKDATVSYGSVDLKFKNSRSYPVMIRIYQSTNVLTAKIFENRNQAE